MYTPTSFRVVDPAVVFSFIERYDFATLITSLSDRDIHVTHLPLLLDQTANRTVLRGHTAAANDHWRAFDGSTQSFAVFHGPNGYVSPTWYKVGPSVPTWNYAVVHAYGSPRIIRNPEATSAVLSGLVRKHEMDKPNPWRIEDLPHDYYEQMANGIVTFEMTIDKIEAKFKLSQNRSREDRQGVVSGLSAESSSSARELAEFMSCYSF